MSHFNDVLAVIHLLGAHGKRSDVKKAALKAYSSLVELDKLLDEIEAKKEPDDDEEEEKPKDELQYLQQGVHLDRHRSEHGTIIFDRPQWTVARARQWLKANGWRAYAKVTATKEHFVFGLTDVDAVRARIDSMRR